MEHAASATKTATAGVPLVFVALLFFSTAARTFADGPAPHSRTQPQLAAPGAPPAPRVPDTATQSARDLPRANDPAEVPVSDIVLVTHSELPLSPELDQAMRHEMDLILESIGIQAGWVPMHIAEGTSFEQRLIVVRFKGDCHCGPGAPASDGPLGHTHVTDGAILPFVELNCPKLAGFVWPEVRRRRAFEPVAMGRAMARVIGHELYHVLSGTVGHGRRGIAKAMLSAEELTRTDFRFDRAEATLILEKLSSARPLPVAAGLRAGP
jgi:hypothetical protein